jgi:hypothetical protein
MKFYNIYQKIHSKSYEHIWIEVKVVYCFAFNEVRKLFYKNENHKNYMFMDVNNSLILKNHNQLNWIRLFVIK